LVTGENRIFLAGVQLCRLERSHELNPGNAEARVELAHRVLAHETAVELPETLRLELNPPL